MTPEVSVVMPAYNAARYIAAALRSLLDQSGVSLEIVVVDDGSIDETPQIVAVLAAADPRVRLIGGEHRGVSVARNTGLAAARADLITFLDADDICPPGKVARQVAVLRADPACEVVHGEILMFEALGADLAPLPGSRSERLMGVILGAATFRRAVFERYGSFDTGMIQSEDMDLYLRLIEADARIRFESEIGVLYRRHLTNITNNLEEARREMLHALQKSLLRRRATGKLLPPNPILSGRYEAEKRLMLANES
jgi:glycosyltransferase involved in cell wall biosynthesis